MDLFQDSFDGELTYDGALCEWVVGKCQDWRDHYEANYSEKHEHYYRLFRNQWSPEDKTRESERSKLIAPALSQAVESNVAEVEEATFGRGKLFDIKDDFQDQEPQDVVRIKDNLHEEFAHNRIRSSVSEVLLNAAVYGTGVAEIVLEDKKYVTPSQRPAADGDLIEYGVETTYRPAVRLNPVQPKSFLIDSNATNIDDALGCAIDEFVSRHVVEELQELGVYNDVYVGDAPADSEIEPDSEIDSVPKGRIRLLKYYGKVPRDLLLAEGVEEEDIKEEGHYVESIVVIANEGVLLKAIPNPYMCQDRPIVAFQWDIVPSRFWGRGVCEKGFMSQKALDAELRARIDALALTTHPMLAVDATRIPRGANLEVKPGRMLLTNGSPQDAIMPFNFGGVSQVTFAQGQQLQQMVSQATGAGDGSQPTTQNDVTAAGQSMGLGAIIKRQKRTLLNFQENFLIPFVRKAAFRYMQFDPDRFPAKDYNFIPFSSLGAMAREYEVAQLTQILQVLSDNPSAKAEVTKGIIDHLNVSNREQLIAALDAASQPNPQEQQAAMAQQQAQLQVLQAQIQLLQSQAAESQSRANKYNTEAELAPTELTLKYSDEDNDGRLDPDFERRVRLAELLLKERELDARQAPQPAPAAPQAPAQPQQPTGQQNEMT